MELERALTIGLVLLAALLHAGWNALAKRSSDPLLALWLVTLSGGLCAALLTPAASFPGRQAWPWLGASLVLHLAYQLFLVAAYRTGDLSQVYPIARGLGPCVVAVLAAALGEEPLALAQVAGLALVSLSIASLAFAGGRARRPAGSALAAAALTGLMIGSYTFVDAKGVRSGAQPIDFIVWSIFLDALPISAVALAARRGRVAPFLARELRHGAGAGAMAALAYGIVLWAMSRASMAGVAALRETGVVFAAWIGTRVFGEPFGPLRVLAAAGVAAGVILIQP
jgi:drug/metabolite transporter (DMT)-like permease